MNRSELKYTNNLFHVLITMSLLASCGGMQSNPKAKYGDDKSAKPISNPTEYKPETVYLKEKEIVYGQPGVFVGTDYFKIKIDNDMEFIEGKESSFNLTAILRLPKVESFNLGISGLPGAKILDMRNSIPNTWKLVWTPAVKTVPESKNKMRFGFSLQIRDLKTTDPDTQKIINSVNLSKDFSADVFHYVVKPVILKNDLPSSINEDETVNFSVWVDALGAPIDAPPILQSYYDSQKSYDEASELITADGYRYLVNPTAQASPVLEDSSKGRWRFSYQIRAHDVPDQMMKKRMTNKELAVKNSPTLNAMISFIASYGTQQSAISVARFQIKRNLKPSESSEFDNSNSSVPKLKAERDSSSKAKPNDEIPIKKVEKDKKNNSSRSSDSVRKTNKSNRKTNKSKNGASINNKSVKKDRIEGAK